jgi:hypothetical protein
MAKGSGLHGCFLVDSRVRLSHQVIDVHHCPANAAHGSVPAPIKAMLRGHASIDGRPEADRQLPRTLNLATKPGFANRGSWSWQDKDRDCFLDGWQP